jgi:fibronectin type 3 domain-containing protein
MRGINRTVVIVLLLHVLAMCQSVTVTSQIRGTSSVLLTWTASTTQGVTYNIYRSEVSGGPYSQIATGVNAVTYTDNKVQHKHTYYYVATAVDGSNNESVYSNEAGPAVIP